MPVIPFTNSPNGTASAAELGSPTWITTNTAFGTVAAKADVLMVWDGQRFVSGSPASDVATGRIFRSIPPRSVLNIFGVGVGGDNEIADVRIWRWKPIINLLDQGVPGVVQLTPQLMWSGSFTLGTAVGLATVAGGPAAIISSSARYADTWTTTEDCSLSPLLVRTMGVPTSGTPNNGRASLVVDVVENALVEFEIRRNTVATSCNLLIESAYIGT